MKELIGSLNTMLMKNILTLSQASLPEHQFIAYRQLIMDEFGKYKRELNGLLKGMGTGSEGNNLNL